MPPAIVIGTANRLSEFIEALGGGKRSPRIPGPKDSPPWSLLGWLRSANLQPMIDLRWYCAQPEYEGRPLDPATQSWRLNLIMLLKN
jgi:hypothetical protein